MRRVLILQAGSADPALRARYGDYPDWFARHLAARVELSVVRPYEQVLPSSAGFDGLVMTGSPKSVLDREPWMDEAAAFLLEAARTRPVLGVCFGHQLLARALGGRVELNPRGREAGTAAVRFTADGERDPLFAGLASPLLVQQTHEDHVAALPAGATLLAENEMSPVQAFAWGESVRCVQFHPEFDADRSRLLAEVRRERLDLQAPGGAAAVRASIRDTPDATSLLGRWLAHYVGA
jgi:GMP synthase (glutamine-hydrolysing)